MNEVKRWCFVMVRRWFRLVSKMNVGRELLGATVTIPRYALAGEMARRVEQQESILVPMLLFVATDLADGMAMRRIGGGEETPLRRVLDGIVDHASQARVMYAVAQNNPGVTPYIWGLTARAGIVGAMNGTHLLLTGEVTKGQKWQRAANLTSATFGIVASTNNKRLMHCFGLIAVATAIVTGIAHSKDIGMMHTDNIRKL